MERPILFSTEMVQAILAGRKTQTRRVMKPQLTIDGKRARRWEVPDMLKHCPYGQRGDLLWVRETWQAISPDEYERPLGECDIYYKADGEHPGLFNPDDPTEPKQTWRPSIYMPRWASRLTLRVTDVRIERVQDISDDDALAEGIRQFDYGIDSYAQARGEEVPVYAYGTEKLAFGAMHNTPKDAFSRLWDSINAKRGFSWDTNPWIWAIEFLMLTD